MRLLAGYKLLLGLLLAVVAFELVRFIDEDLVAVVHVWILRLHADPHHPVVRLVVRKVSSVHVETLEEVAFLTGFLGGVHLIEAFGLWLKKPWAEYLCIISTCVFIPLEVHEMIVGFHVLKLFTLVLNLTIVWYLARRIRRMRTSP
jgi:uncharacterized membrane protein (DUF2068 family)